MKYNMDLHTHSIAGGHAYSTFEENVAAAYEKGLSVYGLSEHAPAMPGGPHMFFFGNLKVLPKEYKGMRILKGCEANIVDLEGNLDLPDVLLAQLDYVIASMHIPCVTTGTAKVGSRLNITLVKLCPSGEYGKQHIGEKVVYHTEDNTEVSSYYRELGKPYTLEK